jgi:hypothetical protein
VGNASFPNSTAAGTIPWYPQTGWEDLGGIFSSPPAVASWGVNRLDIFGVGTDHQMWHKAWVESGGWSPKTEWEALSSSGLILMGTPAVASWGANRLHIFARDRGLGLYHKAWMGKWEPSLLGWTNLGGALNSPPAGASRGANIVDLVARGHNDEMAYMKLDDRRYKGQWQTLGGVFNSTPAVASWGRYRLDIFALGTDKQMWHKGWDGGWFPEDGWEALGGTFNSPPAVASWGANRLDIFALGTDNQMLHKAWIAGWYPS